MLSLFKKKYTPKQIAEQLYYLCAKEEMISASARFYLKGKPEVSPELYSKLRWHTLILHLFICDLACFQKFGNTSLKNNILDEFYKEIIFNLKGQKNDKEIINAVFSEINLYGQEIRGKSIDDQLIGIGKLYADSIDEPNEKVFLMLAGSGIYTQFLITITDWLKEIKIKNI